MVKIYENNFEQITIKIISSRFHQLLLKKQYNILFQKYHYFEQKLLFLLIYSKYFYILILNLND